MGEREDGAGREWGEGEDVRRGWMGGGGGRGGAVRNRIRAINKSPGCQS